MSRLQSKRPHLLQLSRETKDRILAKSSETHPELCNISVQNDSACRFSGEMEIKQRIALGSETEEVGRGHCTQDRFVNIHLKMSIKINKDILRR